VPFFTAAMMPAGKPIASAMINAIKANSPVTGNFSMIMIMPAFVLGNAIAAGMMRHTRSAMLQVLSADFVRTARAKGLPEIWVILRHALRNALIPVVTLVALDFGALLSGAVLTEQVFTIPGFGKLIVDAVFNRDYAVVQGVVLFTAFAYILLNLVADIAYVVLNPRLR
jgi:peptide/nickel transport system permease protein